MSELGFVSTSSDLSDASDPFDAPYSSEPQTPIVQTRIIVGAIALPFVLIPLWLGGIWSVLLVCVIAAIGGHEFYTLLQQGGYRPFYWLGLAWLLILSIHSWLLTFPVAAFVSPLTLVLAGLIITLTCCLFQPEQPIATWLSTSGVAIYLGLVLAQGLALRLLENGLWWLLLGVLITWSNDSAAYFIGSQLGKRKLWPRLSPKKTWEGTIGGWIGGALVGALFVSLSPLPLSPLLGATVGFVASVLALFGDLSISMVKRQIGVKDTGTLFPGHGGMLDRLDSLLFVIPLIYLVAQWAINA